MAGFPSPLTEALDFPTSGNHTPDGIEETPMQEQYVAQWGEDWIRLVERDRLRYEERFFQNTATHQTSGHLLAAAESNRTRQGTESLEMAWLVDHAADVEKHKGEWLLIHGPELIAHDRNFKRIRALIIQRQIHSPFLYYVPTDEESNSVTL